MARTAETRSSDVGGTATARGDCRSGDEGILMMSQLGLTMRLQVQLEKWTREEPENRRMETMTGKMRVGIQRRCLKGDRAIVFSELATAIPTEGHPESSVMSHCGTLNGHRCSSDRSERCRDWRSNSRPRSVSHIR